MGFRGIKNRVLVVFWILFFVSMACMDVLIVSIFLQDSLTRIARQKRSALAFICNAYVKMHIVGHAELAGLIPDRLPDEDVVLLARGQVGDADISASKPAPTLEKLVEKTLRTGQPEVQHVGRSFGIFFWQYRSVVVTQAIKAQGRTVAAAGIESDLTGIYKAYRRIQKIALTLILVISLFFALIANRQLARIYFRPLKRLALRAESYQDENPLFFSVRKEDNEFSILSTSLNKMLHRIAEDKGKLQETIESLKAANRQLKQAQEEVIRAEKLASVGRMTSGIAHEIGNPIGIVLGYLDLLKQDDLNTEDKVDFIQRAESEITRINDIIRQLLDMSRETAGEPASTSIHDLCADLISVFNCQPATNRIDFRTDFSAHRDVVCADPDRLRQVFLNIVLNAVDALEKNGTANPRISFGTENTDVAPNGGKSNECIVVTIRDNGPGIDPDDLPHLFDPFFTTKPPGQGTGLGLSVAIMIVEKMGGRLTAAGHEGNGAIFRVTLPLED